jgi:hypothetical protein
MTKREREIERIESGDAWDDDDQVVEVEVAPRLDKVVPVRLSSQQWARLRREAARRGLGPSSLLRMWMTEKLEEADTRRRAV